MNMNMNMNMKMKLTEFSPGAGCGCKISPKDLEKIIKSDQPSLSKSPFADLLVGHETKDDAAVFRINNDQAIISTTDFFTPIVDDPFEFGQIAATNAISDIYAMGGRPLLAIAILGWPLDKLPAEMAKEVIEGARKICKEANIPLAGGHSIQISDPIFGLAVTGIISPSHLKKNCDAKEGDLLFLTKPLGIGLLTTAEKRGVLKPKDREVAVKLMTTLNKSGELWGEKEYVSAMTDVTGFGLLGHLLELCEGSNLKAEINFENIPKIPGFEYYLQKETIPGGSFRNWDSYGYKIDLKDQVSEFQNILCDPQTSGGLLIAINPNHVDEFLEEAKRFHFFASNELKPFGILKKKNLKNDPSENKIIFVE